MPKWGLTSLQMEAEPWGIPPRLLEPRKTVTDPVHGDVFLNELELQFVDSRPMQRLRGVRQLGTTHLVYPGATHSRFSHALGTLRAAQDLLDAIIDNRDGPRPADDLLEEWPTEPVAGSRISEFDRRWAEVTVLTRLGALLHDLCHVPYGHTIEDDLKVLQPHDANLQRFRKIWEKLPSDLKDTLNNHRDLVTELLPLILSKDPSTGKNFEAQQMRYPFVYDIVGNTICADLVDYLRRDHLYTGLPIGLGTRFANDFYVSRSRLVFRGSRMVVRINRGAQRRVDIVTELLKYLRFRYELSERVLYHHAKLSADAMLAKMLEMWSDWLWFGRAKHHQPDLAEAYGAEALGQLKTEVAKLQAPEGFEFAPPTPQPGDQPRTLADAIMQEVREELEAQFTSRSDDGMLEYLRDWGAAGTDGRRRAVGTLADSVANRELFKRIGRASSAADQANDADIYAKFGPPDERRRVEETAAFAADLDPGWQVVVWVPKPGMRLKVAGVLVDENGQITPLDTTKFPGIKEIYENHSNLWALNVYAHPRVLEPDSNVDPDVLLMALADEMGIDFLRPDGSRVVPEEPRGLSNLIKLAVVQLTSDSKLPPDSADQLMEVAAHNPDGADPEFGKGITFRDIKQRVRRWGQGNGLLPADTSV
jgi:HD superfamily phosphohydrolase